MRLLEVTDYAVRSSALRLTRRESPLQFLIFPMVHIADAAFYAEVTSRLRRVDLIVAEGVGRPPDPEPPADDPTLNWPGLELEDLPPVRRRLGPLATLSALTASYRMAARSSRLGLVDQNIDYEALGVPVLNPDMTEEEFIAGWRELPAWMRAMAMAAGPFVALDRAAFGSRRSLASGLSLDDRDVFDASANDSQLLDLIIAKRDRLLVTALDAIHDVHASDPLTVAVVYGAYHVPAVVEHLRTRYGYFPRDAEWLTVFTLD